jgi:hypothetical protein
MREIQRAHPSARRRAVLLVIIGAVMGGAALFALEESLPSIKRWLLSDPEQLSQRLATLTGFFVLLTVVPLFALAIDLWFRGVRIRQHRRFPIGDEGLVRDTLIVHGEAAVTLGWVLQCLAIALATLALGLAVVLWRLAAIVGHHVA